MEYKANYTLVGLFVIILGLATLAIALWLSVGLDSKSYDTYEVFMNEAVSGLSEQAPVKFNGVTVGMVKAIRLNKHNPQQVSLLLDIERDAPVTTSTVATLLSQGITGITYIGLTAKTAVAPRLIAKSGQQYPVIPSQPSLLVQLDQSLRQVTESVKDVSMAIKIFFDKKNAKAVAQILDNVAIASKQFPQLIKDMNSAGSAVTMTMKHGNDTLEAISPPTVNFIQRMNNIANNLEQLSRDLKQNPAVVLSGKSPPKLGPGER